MSRYDKMRYVEIFDLLGGREAAYAAYFDGTISDPDLRAEFENKCYAETTAAAFVLIRVAKRLEDVTRILEEVLRKGVIK